MLGRLLRWTFGYRFSWRPRRTSLANSVGLFKGTKFAPPLFWGLALQGIPAVAGLTYIILVAPAVLPLGRASIYLVYLAVAWSWLGPWLVWRYEVVLARKFVLESRSVLPRRSDRARLYAILAKRPTGTVFGLMLLTSWITFILVMFLLNTPLWYHPVGVVVLLPAGVLVYSYYTGIGFLLAIRSSILARALARSRIRLDPYHADGCGGLGFAGWFAAKTSFMLASGILFVPLLLQIALSGTGVARYYVYVAVAIYSAAIFASFLVPLQLIRSALKREKWHLIAGKSREIQAKMPAAPNDPAVAAEMKVLREIWSDLKAISESPVDLKTLAAVSTTVLLPIAVALVRELIVHLMRTPGQVP